MKRKHLHTKKSMKLGINQKWKNRSRDNQGLAPHHVHNFFYCGRLPLKRICRKSKGKRNLIIDRMRKALRKRKLWFCLPYLRVVFMWNSNLAAGKGQRYWRGPWCPYFNFEQILYSLYGFDEFVVERGTIAIVVVWSKGFTAHQISIPRINGNNNTQTVEICKTIF